MPEPMSCPEMVELVSDYLEGVLPAALRETFEHHLELCDGCTTYVAQLRETVAATGRLSEDDVDSTVMDRLVAAFADWRDSPT
jgi:anti-sigma factor RsiW